MYINTFKYTPKDVSCQLCTEYVKKLGCTMQPTAMRNASRPAPVNLHRKPGVRRF